MKLNPYINASVAVSYIILIASVFSFISKTRSNTPDTLIDPIIALSTLVFSVALMGFLFFYQPISLLLENKREQAVSFFLKTLGTFFVFILIFGLLLGLK